MSNDTRKKRPDEYTPDELPEIGLNEGDRPISTDDYLDVDGICVFPSKVDRYPSGITIASPFLGVSDLIKAVYVDTEDGPKQVTYTEAMEMSRKARETNANVPFIAIVKDLKTIEMLQDVYNGKGVMLSRPNDPTTEMTLSQWEDMFKTDGIMVIAMMRLFWKVYGGGVRVTKPDTKLDVKFTKLGKGGITNVRGGSYR